MRFFHDLPLKRKLTLIIMATCTAALLLACVAFTAKDIMATHESAKFGMTAIADVMGANSTASLTFKDTAAAEETLMALRSQPHIMRGCIYTPEGNLFAKYRRGDVAAKYPVVSTMQGHRFEGNSMVLWRPIVLNGEIIGTICLQADLSEWLDRAIQSAWIVASVLVASMFVALLLSAKLQRRVSDPILGLLQTTRDVSRNKDYSVRAGKETADEIGQLIGGFNDMLEQIQKRDLAIRDNEVRYRALFENASEAVWLLSDTILDCNQRACDLWGCQREDIIGHSPVEFSPPTQPDGRASVEAAKERIGAAFDGQPQLFYWKHLRKDGTLVDTEISLTGMMLGSQRLVLVIGRDITERKRTEANLEQLHRQLLETSRAAGMAEVATNVLHNVGNVLNSVSVSSTLIADKIRNSKIINLTKATALISEHIEDLGVFLANDPKGKQLPGYLVNLSQHLAMERDGILKETDHLTKNVEHIKEIVAMQQSFAKVAGVIETLSVTDLVEDALRLNVGSLRRHGIEVVREYGEVPPFPLEKHKVLQILINLVRNAKYALVDSGRNDKRLTMRIGLNGHNTVKVSVIDNGVGIAPENLTRIFSHGFTTRKEGHGFGLHSGALAAKELGGALTLHSDGPGKGAVFTLELPNQGNRGVA